MLEATVAGADLQIERRGSWVLHAITPPNLRKRAA
jgi:hypothetical protein